MNIAASRGVPVTLQSAATTGNGTAIAIPNSFTQHEVNLKGSAGISAGKVQVETADAIDYAGTWAAVGSEQTLIASTELRVSFSGIYRFIRARISTTVSNGTLDASYVGS